MGRSGWLAVPAALALACGPSGNGGGGGNGSDGGGGGGVDAPPNQYVDADPNAPDGGCGLQEEEVELVNLGPPPDMLIVLDRSGSMSSPLITFPTPSFTPKWNIMRDALKSVVMSTENNINWGLSTFPTDNDCGVSAGTEVGIAAANYTPIKNWLEDGANSPNGNTPAAQGLTEALNYYNSITPNPDGRYVLFATDGVPNCDVDEATAATNTVNAVTALANAGIDTFVIGFGDITGATGVLNDAAQEGNTARPGGPPYYYEANDAASLQMALEQIAGGVIIPSCSYELASAPPDPNAVTVKIDGNPVPRSTQHTNGWDYYPDSMTITFFGSYCDDIESGSVTSVEFFFGCPGPQID